MVLRSILALLLAMNALLLAQSHKMVKNAHNEYFYLSFTHKPRLRPIPDLQTALALGFEENKIATVDTSYLADFNVLPELKSLHLSEVQLKSPNEVMRVRISKIMTLAPTTYVLELYKVLQGLNPSIEIVEGELLMAYREGIYNKPIQFAWLNKTTFEVMEMHSHLGIASGLIAPIQKFNFNPIQEDPRLMMSIHNKQMYIQYTAKVTIMNGPSPCHAIININGDKDITSSSYEDSILMDKHGLKDFRNPKNWVMFMFDDRLHFIQNINPMRVFAVKSVDHNTHYGEMEVIQQDTVETALPWGSEYDSLIRGGTPMIPITTQNNTKLYIQFFHTAATSPFNVKTYYMGALTVCPTRPFRIHSMSSRPIVPRSSFYQGQWANPPLMDYVVFPTGIVLLDPLTLLVSFGSQDVEGYVMKMDLYGLLDTLSLVKEC